MLLLNENLKSVILHTITCNIHALFEGLVCRVNTLLVLPSCLVINLAEEIKRILSASFFFFFTAHDSIKNDVNLVKRYTPFIETVHFVVCTFYSKNVFPLKTFFFENWSLSILNLVLLFPS